MTLYPVINLCYLFILNQRQKDQRASYTVESTQKMQKYTNILCSLTFSVTLHYLNAVTASFNRV